jgi:predicted ribosome quality control (RQC) complex YloA/Tae2 family protein
MIQYYLDLEKQVKVINESLRHQGQIQKIYSTSFYISINIRSLGRNWHLYLGRGGGYEGVWLSNKAPPSRLRRKDVFLEYLRKHLSSCRFLGVSIDQSDRIIKIDYQKFGQIQSLFIFWKGRQLYFGHHFQETPEGVFKTLMSWNGKATTDFKKNENLFELFNQVGRQIDMSHEMSSKNILSIDELLVEEEKLANLQTLNSAPQFLLRKKENIKEDLRKAMQWEKLQKILDNGDSLEKMYELKIEDQKIKLEGELTPYERRGIVFDKIKKLKRGVSILSARLNEVEEELLGKKTEKKKVNELSIIKPVWGAEKKVKTLNSSTKETLEYRIFLYNGMQFGIGQNAIGNDQLRNKWATKEDFWFHLDGYKSSHLILKVPSGQQFSISEINVAASILAQFSHFSGDWIPVIYTQVKYLKGVSGASGMVIYKKEKHLQCQRVSLDDVLKD